MADSIPTKRIWRIAHSEASLGWGGQEHRILAEMKGFRGRGSEVWLVAPPNSQLYQRAAEAGIPVRAQYFNQRYLLPLHVMRMARWLKKHRIEIVNPHSSRDGWLLTLAARIARVPLIIRSRHFDVPIPNKSLSRLMYKEWSHHIITTSPKITDTLVTTFDLDPSEVCTIPTGVDLQRFRPDGPRAALPLPALPAGTPLVGMITVIRYAKGTQILAEAAGLLREQGLRIHCVIVGDGPWRAHLEEAVQKLGVQDLFTLTGHREDVPDIMRAFDIVAIPSFHEAIPQSGLQALATGVPVVASNIGGIPSIIKDGETGRLVPMKDPAALAQAIRDTLEQREKTQALCAEGRRFIEREHSLENMLDRLEAIYHQHLG
ncbi:glycosyltransferase [Prosthecobacter sp.]|uniref:glycosyltransferase n=1 Tax=Prosthecobacter sp. TaxID=1965333 RepID=UPI003782E3CB